jgi:hypothetical protein
MSTKLQPPEPVLGPRAMRRIQKLRQAVDVYGDRLYRECSKCKHLYPSYFVGIDGVLIGMGGGIQCSYCDYLNPI